MDRKEFITTCGLACMGTLVTGTLLTSCTSMKRVDGTITGDYIALNPKEFEKIKKDKTVFRDYIIVQNNSLRFPICVYRIEENNYSALVMECTHQGQELTAYGDKLHCSSHGSEFDKMGNVTNGPAYDPLKTLPVTTEGGMLRISIKST